MNPLLRSLLFVLSALTALSCRAQQQPEAFLTGKIKGLSGSSATVIVDELNGPAAWHARTSRDGSYKVGPLPPGRFRVCIALPAHNSIVKEMTIDSATKPFSPGLGPVLTSREEECPSLSKVFLALTPAELEHAWFTLQVSGGSWSGQGYSLTVFADGRAPISTPPSIPRVSDGVPTLPMRPDPDIVSNLFQQFYAAGFFSLHSSHLPFGSDAATTSLSFGVEGLTKTVQHLSGGGPRELLALEDEIQTVMGVHSLLHGSADNETLFGGVGDDLRLVKPGMTPLLRAAGSADLETFKRLVAEGQDPGAVDSSGWNALMIAASEGNDEIVGYLLAHAADPNARSHKGETALMAAAGGWSGEVFAVKALLSAGADPNAENDEGQTALIWAARRARPAVIAALLAAHADVNHRAKDGSSALQLLRSDLGERSKECLELLRTAGATK